MRQAEGKVAEAEAHKNDSRHFPTHPSFALSGLRLPGCIPIGKPATQPALLRRRRTGKNQTKPPRKRAHVGESTEMLAWTIVEG